ncbi:16S rRNA (-N2)-methyltransferase [Enterococcus sp. DIV0755b]|uniref:class I SAM-dependent methyltransferase n=1 Tax=Enterococcus sp. DIV0755b TaxID=2774657 RepID=UPI003F202C2D
MSDHYYTNQPHAAHDFTEFDFELKGHKFHFVTDSGVFSRNTIDYGSRVLIETFSATDLPKGPLLDVGCGYGPIGLTLAATTERFVEMIDVNQRAIDLAKRNAGRNQIENVVIHESNIYETVNETAYAAILSNPPIRAGKKVVHTILSDAYPLLTEGGTLTVVIQKKQGAPSAEKKMKEVFGNCTILTKDKGYYILQSIKED